MRFYANLIVTFKGGITAMTTLETTNRFGDRIAVGQTWADNDPREEGRTVRVVEIDGRHAYIETITRQGGVPAAKRKPTRVLTDRLHPIRSGFRLIQDVPANDKGESQNEGTTALPDSSALHRRLQAFARDCVANGDMTPTAQRMLHAILDEDARSQVGVQS